MAVDMFLKLAGIKGESLDHKHKDEIEVLSFSFGISQTHAAGGGGAAGKVQFEDVLISSVSPAGNMGDVPMEQVSFNFASVKVEARRQSANGSFGPWETTSCDLAAQKE